MIKIQTVGGIQAAKINPVLTSNTAVTNMTIKTIDSVAYYIWNELSGDDAYKSDVAIPAGEMLNGYRLDSLVGLGLVIDGKHIGDGESVDNLKAGDILVIGANDAISVADAAPQSGIYFVVKSHTFLTEPAVIVEVTQA